MHSSSVALFSALLALATTPAGAHEPQPHDYEPSPRGAHLDGFDPDPDVGVDDPAEQGWSRRLGLGGGYFAPWQGEHGHQAQLELLAESPSGHFRIGGEFVHRQFDTRVFDVKSVEVNSYSFDLLMHYVLNPGGLTPYLGAGIGLQANDLSKRDLKRASSALDVRDDVGLGYGLFGLLGLELPISRDAVLFAEGRLNLAYQITGRNGARVYADYYKDGVDKTAVEDLGGGSGVFGLRVRF
jgi:hypothetical protein